MLIGAAVGIVVLIGVGLAPTVGLVAMAWALGGVATQLVLVGVNLLVLRSSPVNRGGSMSLVQAIRFGGGSLAPVVFTPLYGVAPASTFLLAAAVVAVVIPVALPQGPSTPSSARA